MKRMSQFEIWMRSGRIVAQPKKVETKFNPWHDPDNGRFTFAGQGNYFGSGVAGRSENGAKRVAKTSSLARGGSVARPQAGSSARASKTRATGSARASKPNSIGPSVAVSANPTPHATQSRATSKPASEGTTAANSHADAAKVERIRFDDLPASIRNHPSYSEMVLLTLPDGSGPLFFSLLADPYTSRGIEHERLRAGVGELSAVLAVIALIFTLAAALVVFWCTENRRGWKAITFAVPLLLFGGTIIARLIWLRFWVFG